MESNMSANGDGPRHFESLQLTHYHRYANGRTLSFDRIYAHQPHLHGGYASHQKGGDGFRNFELRSSDEDDTSALKHLPNANDMDVLGIKVLTLMCLGVMRLGFHPIISPWPQIMKPYLVVSGGRKSVQ
ncbi:hypothetical protein TNCV_2607411 [Trichonephila clavipes]|uniref:Uncharacterized protein n=1 Tax=Trichonephila clavipes TaxID=2585209 RepID=A0A8X6S262_TRICX|nr:hypothetical protein TNCV_2607411 [Trichonephila clavipes]